MVATLRALINAVNPWGTPNPPNPPAPPPPRVGDFYADYSLPTQEQLKAPQPELDELFKQSKVVSVKREL
jgi:hypothetical protein